MTAHDLLDQASIVGNSAPGKQIEKETSMTEAAAVESMTPIRIKNSDLSDDAKRLWAPSARWGSANGKLFAKNLDEFLWKMSNELGLEPARVRWLMEEMIRSGLHPEIFARETTFNELPDSINARKVRLLKVIGRLN